MAEQVTHEWTPVERAIQYLTPVPLRFFLCRCGARDMDRVLET
jgi:hypothetical protein